MFPFRLMSRAVYMRKMAFGAGIRRECDMFENGEIEVMIFWTT